MSNFQTVIGGARTVFGAISSTAGTIKRGVRPYTLPIISAATAAYSLSGFSSYTPVAMGAIALGAIVGMRHGFKTPFFLFPARNELSAEGRGPVLSRAMSVFISTAVGITVMFGAVKLADIAGERNQKHMAQKYWKKKLAVSHSYDAAVTSLKNTGRYDFKAINPDRYFWMNNHTAIRVDEKINPAKGTHPSVKMTEMDITIYGVESVLNGERREVSFRLNVETPIGKDGKAVYDPFNGNDKNQKNDAQKNTVKQKKAVIPAPSPRG